MPVKALTYEDWQNYSDKEKYFEEEEEESEEDENKEENGSTSNSEGDSLLISVVKTIGVMVFIFLLAKIVFKIDVLAMLVETGLKLLGGG